MPGSTRKLSIEPEILYDKYYFYFKLMPDLYNFEKY